MRVALSGHDLELLPERAVWWPALGAVVIADPHFGKSATFRQMGLPLPERSEQRDLERLSDLLTRYSAGRLVVLGDFWHSRSGRTESTLQSLATWRAAHAEIDILLIRGNHDVHAGDPPSSWRFRCATEPYPESSSARFAHDPGGRDVPAREGLTLAGHIHPVVTLRDGAGRRMRLPCFHYRAGSGRPEGGEMLVLPAFGGLTGGAGVAPEGEDRIFAVGPDRVIEVPLAPAAAGSGRP